MRSLCQRLFFHRCSEALEQKYSVSAVLTFFQTCALKFASEVELPEVPFVVENRTVMILREHLKPNQSNAFTDLTKEALL